MFNPPSPSGTNAQAMSTGAQLASQQNAWNQEAGIESQQGSMVNQYNPYGSLEYVQTGTGTNGIPIYSSKLSLTPQMQQMFNTLMGTKTTAGQQGNKLIADANYGGANPADVIGDATKGNTAALMKMQTDYLNPFFTTSKSQLDTKLRNQGLAPGMPVYDNAMRQLDTNQGLVVSKAASEFEPEAYKQATANYLLPWNLGKDLASFGAPGDPKSELVQTPNLNINPANLIGAVTGEQSIGMDQYKAQMDQYKNMMSGIFGVPTAILGGWGKAGMPGMSNLLGAGSAGAGAATGTEALEGAEALGTISAMFSDERVKEDIAPVGKLYDGQPVYSYKYIGDPTPRIGLMAQDVEETVPEAVHDVGGIKAVNYAKATERSRMMAHLLGR